MAVKEIIKCDASLHLLSFHSQWVEVGVGVDEVALQVLQVEFLCQLSTQLFISLSTPECLCPLAGLFLVEPYSTVADPLPVY